MLAHHTMRHARGLEHKDLTATVCSRLLRGLWQIIWGLHTNPLMEVRRLIAITPRRLVGLHTTWVGRLMWIWKTVFAQLCSGSGSQ